MWDPYQNDARLIVLSNILYRNDTDWVSLHVSEKFLGCVEWNLDFLNHCFKEATLDFD